MLKIDLNPLDYSKNIIGALKTEIAFWLFGLLGLAPWVTYFISPLLMVFLGVMGWFRLSYLISHYLEERRKEK
ncbi:MAG: hypothetical protein U9N34_07720 [Candidatus Cloacimonadota bacterium]|nr:hypothetical protein [Candidatus Cloacimonadota bacterium]